MQSCIHCHQIGDAQQQTCTATARSRSRSRSCSPTRIRKSLGLILDPKERATVLRRRDRTRRRRRPASRRATRSVKLEGQPLLSIADVQWVLHQTPRRRAATLTARCSAATARQELTLTLPKGWRQRDDISWRASTWGLRRMATGGMLLETPTPRNASKAGLPDTAWPCASSTSASSGRTPPPRTPASARTTS